MSGMGAFKTIALTVAAWGLCACTTVNAPVLRHETGETLGSKHLRVMGHFESSRLFQPAATAETAGIAQGNSVFEGSLLGVQVDGGVLPQLDLQLGANFTLDGGGWKAGAKYQFFRSARLAAAAMLGYAKSSGSGTVTYLTSGTPVQIDQTLSTYTIDLSVPVSFRINPSIAVYSGLMLLRSGATGSLGNNVVSDISNDIGSNLGVKVTVSMFEGDVEVAYLLVHDPFTDSAHFIPYAGFSFGVKF
jgi:hypothetical protein